MNFTKYLKEAQQAVERETNSKVVFYLGEYTPDIDNFHYQFCFASQKYAYKVTVNTWDNGSKHRFIIAKYSSLFKASLAPINVLPQLTLMEAYQRAESKGFHPDVSDAVVFLENYLKSNLGIGYWFLDKNGPQWIFVSCQDENEILITDIQPYS